VEEIGSFWRESNSVVANWEIIATGRVEYARILQRRSERNSNGTCIEGDLMRVAMNYESCEGRRVDKNYLACAGADKHCW